MAKIDISKIPGYSEMSIEDRLKTLETFEYEDNSVEFEKLKNSLSKANSEAAEWKRKHNSLLSEDEKKKQEQAEKLSSMEKELDELRKDKIISEYKVKLIAQGYDESLAADTAMAMADGDTVKIFANQEKFLEDYVKKVRIDAMKKTPKPPAGGASDDIDYSKKIEEARQTGDMAAVAYYTRLEAQKEAQAKQNE